MKNRWIVLFAVVVTGLSTVGCATKKYVRTETGASEARSGERIDDVQTQVESAQSRLDAHDARIGDASATAQEALERALAAGKLAEGKFLYETVLSDDKVRFESDRAELNDAARAAIDEFARSLKATNANVFIEIQGHTDSTGSDDHNLKLGEARAESVRRYLSQAHGIALHRMSIISYGESAPVADNKTREGRAQNRRVLLVVLQ